MAEYTFKKLGEVEALIEVPEGANAFIEVDGEVKRVPGDGLGGAGGIKTAIIKSSDYDNGIAGLQTTVTAEPEVTYECINMTFEEAYQTMAMGEPLSCVLMISGEGAMNVSGTSAFVGSAMVGVPCILLFFSLIIGGTIGESYTFYWTADGISTEAPSSDE